MSKATYQIVRPCDLKKCLVCHCSIDSEEIKSICKNSEQTILIHISIIDS